MRHRRAPKEHVDSDSGHSGMNPAEIAGTVIGPSVSMEDAGPLDSTDAENLTRKGTRRKRRYIWLDELEDVGAAEHVSVAEALNALSSRAPTDDLWEVVNTHPELRTSLSITPNGVPCMTMDRLGEFRQGVIAALGVDGKPDTTTEGGVSPPAPDDAEGAEFIGLMTYVTDALGGNKSRAGKVCGYIVEDKKAGEVLKRKGRGHRFDSRYKGWVDRKIKKYSKLVGDEDDGIEETRCPARRKIHEKYVLLDDLCGERSGSGVTAEWLKRAYLGDPLNKGFYEEEMDEVRIYESYVTRAGIMLNKYKRQRIEEMCGIS